MASQPCLVCGRTPADAHHLRFAQPRALGMKVSDEFTVPVCRSHHRDLHRVGDERAWWHNLNIDPMPIAMNLWERGGAVRTRTIMSAASADQNTDAICFKDQSSVTAKLNDRRPGQ